MVTNKVSTAELKIVGLEKELDCSKNQTTQKEHELQALKEKFECKETESAEMTKAIENERNDFKNENSIAEVKLKEVIGEKEKAEDLYETYKTSTEDKLNKILPFEAETEKSKSEVDAMKENVSEMNKTVQDAQELAEQEKLKAQKAIEEKLACELKMWELTEKVESLNSTLLLNKTEMDSCEQAIENLKSEKEEVENLLQKKNNEKIISTSSENANLNDKTDNLQQTLEEINLKLKEDEIDLDKEREKVSQLSCKLLKQEEEFKTQFLENEEMVSKLDKIACDLMEKKLMKLII